METGKTTSPSNILGNEFSFPPLNQIAMSTAVTNSIPDDSVYTGVWINWSHGRVRGATLTLTHRDGGLLTAFLALFVTVVGISFWRLFCFAMHTRFSAMNVSQDGLYHQRQAVLRNAATSTIGLRYFVQMVWAWRSRASRRWLRILPVMSVTLILTAAFQFASIFSSQVR